jgi:hypothetical protein
MDTSVHLEYKETPTLPHFCSQCFYVYVAVSCNMEYVTPATSATGSYTSYLIPGGLYRF